MRKLIVEEWLTLDGYAEDRNGKLDFFPPVDNNKYSDDDQLKFLETIDTILLGRKTYELFVDFWPTASTDVEVIADKLNSIPKTIFSNTIKAAPWGKWPAASVISGNAIDEIKKLKQQPGKDIVCWGSITLAQTLMEANLVDEYHLQICPVIAGGGRLFYPPATIDKKLKLINTRQYNTGVIYAHYEPI